MSKNQKEQKGFDLEHAIKEMSNLIRNDNGSSQGGQAQSNDINSKKFDLQQYLQMLGKKYNNLNNLLQKQQKDVQTLKFQREKLKSELADTIRRGQNEIQQQANEIQQLEQNLRTMQSSVQVDQANAKFKRIEIQKIDQIISNKQQEIKEKISLTIQNQQEIDDFQQKLVELQNQRELLQIQIKSELETIQTQQMSMDQISAEFNRNQKDYKDLLTKNTGIQAQLNTMFGTTVGYEEESKKLTEEQSQLLKKANTLQKRVEDLTSLRERLLQENEIKTNQMAMIRQENSQLDQIVKATEKYEIQYKEQRDIYYRLVMENQILSRKKEEVSNLDLMGKQIKQILEKGDSNNSPFREHQNNYSNHNGSQQQGEGLQNQSRIDHLDPQLQLQDLQKNYNDQSQIVANQIEAIKYLQNEITALKENIEKDEMERKILNQKYDLLEKQMDDLNMKYYALGNLVDSFNVQAHSNTNFNNNHNYNNNNNNNFGFNAHANRNPVGVVSNSRQGSLGNNNYNQPRSENQNTGNQSGGSPSSKQAAIDIALSNFNQSIKTKNSNNFNEYSGANNNNNNNPNQYNNLSLKNNQFNNIQNQNEMFARYQQKVQESNHYHQNNQFSQPNAKLYQHQPQQFDMKNKGSYDEYDENQAQGDVPNQEQPPHASEQNYYENFDYRDEGNIGYEEADDEEQHEEQQHFDQGPNDFNQIEEEEENEDDLDNQQYEFANNNGAAAFNYRK